MARNSLPNDLLTCLDVATGSRGPPPRRLVVRLLKAFVDAFENPAPQPRWELSLRRPKLTEPDSGGLGRVLPDHPRWTTEPAELAADEAGPVPCRLIRDARISVVVRYLPRSHAIRITIGEPDPPADAQRGPDANGIILLDPGECWLDLRDAAWTRVVAEAECIADHRLDAPEAEA